jgi:hypothetical protein
MASDLAKAVVSAAAHNFKKESEASACGIEIEIRSLLDNGATFTHIYTIKAMPMSQHVLLQYKSMTWKLPRNDSSAWQQTIEFIYEAVTSSTERPGLMYFSQYGWEMGNVQAMVVASVAVGDDFVHVRVGDDFVHVRECGDWESLEKVFRMCMMSMQYMAATV